MRFYVCPHVRLCLKITGGETGERRGEGPSYYCIYNVLVSIYVWSLLSLLHQNRRLVAILF